MVKPNILFALIVCMSACGRTNLEHSADSRASKKSMAPCVRLSVHEEVHYHQLAAGQLEEQSPQSKIFIQGVERCESEIRIYYQLDYESAFRPTGTVVVNEKTGKIGIEPGE
jgi:hypothetical protein